jgi:transposase, IS30 family
MGGSLHTQKEDFRRHGGGPGVRLWKRQQKKGSRIRSRPRKLTAPLRRKIEAKLRQMRWSPEQISGWLFEQGIKLSHERICQMIWQDKRDGGDLWRNLRRVRQAYPSADHF